MTKNFKDFHKFSRIFKDFQGFFRILSQLNRPISNNYQIFLKFEQILTGFSRIFNDLSGFIRILSHLRRPISNNYQIFVNFFYPIITVELTWIWPEFSQDFFDIIAGWISNRRLNGVVEKGPGCNSFAYEMVHTIDGNVG